MSDLDWRDDANCRDVDPELFFPEKSPGTGRRVPKIVAVICGNCKVRAACLNYAIRKPENFGIWGGLNADQLRALRRKRRVS